MFSCARVERDTRTSAAVFGSHPGSLVCSAGCLCLYEYTANWTAKSDSASSVTGGF